MECWNIGILGFYPTLLKKIIIHEINQSWNEKISIEDLDHLNFALGSCGEFHSCYVGFKQAGQISDDEYEKLNTLHYKVENKLLKLIKSLQRKQKNEVWEDNFQTK